ncbi:hypothetical protein [Sporisorium scitamineum]|uniref:Uncharacterized protein n=1 Tax=Sporisorium scitamineum TaxID=49012 RepID=A0A0F7S8E6_9BASI|nr:hypothetical protein [Sporisorium scitamineum]
MSKDRLREVPGYKQRQAAMKVNLSSQTPIFIIVSGS